VFGTSSVNEVFGTSSVNEVFGTSSVNEVFGTSTSGCAVLLVGRHPPGGTRGCRPVRISPAHDPLCATRGGVL